MSIIQGISDKATKGTFIPNQFISLTGYAGNANQTFLYTLFGDLLDFSKIGIVTTNAAFNAFDGNILVDASMDGTNYVNVGTITFPSNRTALVYSDTNFLYRYLKLTYAKGTNSAGTYDIQIILKNA